MLPVVIGTNPERADWLRDCLKSIRATTKHRRVLIHDAGGYEIAALRTGIARFQRFLFLQDSTEVLHPDFWDAIDTSGPTWLFGGPPMYLAIYDSAELAEAITDASDQMDKRLAIAWESELPQRLNYPTLWPDITDATGHQEFHNGRLNLVLENHLLRKWKGNWGQG